MEHFKIKDFSVASKLGIDKLVQNAIQEHTGKKDPGKLEAFQIIKILKDSILVSH